MILLLMEIPLLSYVFLSSEKILNYRLIDSKSIIENKLHINILFFSQFQMIICFHVKL